MNSDQPDQPQEADEELVKSSETAEKLPFFQNFWTTRRIIVIIGALLLLIFVIFSTFAFSNLIRKPQNYSLTKKDFSSTIHIKPNDTIKISTPIPSDFKISTEITNPKVVISQKTQTTGGNYTGNLIAGSPGETDIFVDGRPNCKTSICLPLIETIYKIHIVVDK